MRWPWDILNQPTWKMTETAFQHKNPADDAKQDLLLGNDGQRSQGASQRKGPHVSHEYLGGIGIIPEKTDARPDNGAAENGELARSRHIGDLQVTGDLDVACKVGEEQIGHEAGNGRTDGQPVQPVGEIDGIGRADDDEGGKQNIPEPQIGQNGFEKGNRYVGCEIRLNVQDETDKQCQQNLPGQPHPSRNASAAFVQQFSVIVHEADEAVPHGHQ
jgi:hypothetical protein